MFTRKILVTAAAAVLTAHSAMAAEVSLEQRVKALEDQVAALMKAQPPLASPGAANPTVSRAPAIEAGSLKVTKWDYASRNGEYGQMIYWISYTLLNGYEKPIKLIKGSLQFQDLLGERVYGIALDQDVKIAPGKECNFGGDYRRNQFIASEQRLAAMSKGDVLVRLVVETVVFADNTVLNTNQPGG